MTLGEETEEATSKQQASSLARHSAADDDFIRDEADRAPHASTQTRDPRDSET